MLRGFSSLSSKVSWPNLATELIRTCILTFPLVLTNLAAVRAEAFGRTWMSMPSRTLEEEAQGPLGEFVLLLQSTTGKVLELGPGDGRQIQFLTNHRIEAIYGAEPCVALHHALHKSVKTAGIVEIPCFDLPGRVRELRSSSEACGFFRHQWWRCLWCHRVLKGIV